MIDTITSTKRALMLGMIVSVLLIAQPAGAEDLSASLAYLPNILENSFQGGFIDLTKAIDEVYTTGRIIIEVSPFSRSINKLISGEVDFHLPCIRNPLIPEVTLRYRYISEILGRVSFVIYSHKKHPLTRLDIDNARSIEPFPFVIETDRALVDLFEFPIQSSSAIAQSMKKIRFGRIDAYIFAQEESDYVIQRLKLKMIHRALYQVFDDVIIVNKNAHGDKIDRLLSHAIDSLRSTGRLQALYNKVHRPYLDWQPWQGKTAEPETPSEVYSQQNIQP